MMAFQLLLGEGLNVVFLPGISDNGIALILLNQGKSEILVFLQVTQFQRDTRGCNKLANYHTTTSSGVIATLDHTYHVYILFSYQDVVICSQSLLYFCWKF